ncbi:MAG: TonB family protein [Ignavibacteria bacterium]|nr:TonB family protein [Ignavibacteria bacterium]
MRTTYQLAISAVLVLAIWGCSTSKQEPIVNKADSTAAAVAAKERAIAAADSVEKAAQVAKDSIAKAIEDKAEEVAAEIKNSHPEAYDPTPVDKEPETDMESLRKAITYPKDAMAKGIEGRVRVRGLVGKSGRVTRSFVENSSNVIFDEPSRIAVSKARFTPAINKGKRIERWISVPVIYRLM